MTNEAIFGACSHHDTCRDDCAFRHYRYWLTRELDVGLLARGPCWSGPLVVIGLNPSTATATADDPTIRRERNYALSWGFDRYIKVNAYAFRTPSPETLGKARKAGVDVVGPQNDVYLQKAMEATLPEGEGMVLAAWGVHAAPERVQRIVQIANQVGVVLRCLGTNADGSPKHPLYLKKSTPHRVWEGQSA